MRLLISDANIIIDLEDGGLLDPVFELPWQYRTPDMLYFDELEEQHSDLLSKGLQLGELTPEGMEEAERLIRKYPHPGRYDCFALALAKQEACPLLTGDQRLRHAAKAERVVVAGTLWLVEAMVVHEVISLSEAERAYRRMQETGRRLPWERAATGLQGIANGCYQLRDPFTELGQSE